MPHRRRHHNTKGLGQVRRGKTREQVDRMAERILRDLKTTTGLPEERFNKESIREAAEYMTEEV